MKNRVKYLIACATAFSMAGVTAHAFDDHASSLSSEDQQAMQAALASPTRTKDTARDEFRHPAETLAFFGVKPGMTVVDYLPSGGWYTRLLVPYLGEKGQYIGLNPDVTGQEDRFSRFEDLADTFPAEAAEMTGVPAERILAFNANSVPDTVNGTVDRALIFREMHNMHRFDFLGRDLKSIRRMLKNDGMLGIVQHRANADAPFALSDGNKGYLREEDVIKLVEAQGFELVAKSEINANPKDTKDYARGVWTLPPAFAAGDENRDKYAAIGESDRMTLLFRKRP